MAITIVGLGPGNPKLLTREAWELLSGATEIYCRTRHHPTVVGLPPQVQVFSFDALYDELDDFAAVYATIVEQVLQLGTRPEGVIYAVPGHPLMGEATVTGVLESAPSLNVSVRLVDGLSFVEPVLSALKVDGMAGLQVVDALDVAACLFPPLDPDRPALLGQLYSREIASDVKLTLMNQYPDEHLVHLVHAAGADNERVEAVPLYEIDHSAHVAHLTSLFVPPLPQTSGLASFQETIAHLRNPGGCPWDQQQTHKSLRADLIEETAEVLDALDAGDMEALCEELGDLLLHIVMHTQIASEEGDFNAAQVVAGIEAKIRRRHPHVFAHVEVDGVGQVLENWDSIKQQEHDEAYNQSAMNGVPAALPALAQADKIARRAVQVGFDWQHIEEVIAKVREEMEELLAAGSLEEQEAELGDLLFTLVNWARWLGLDAESALRLANKRFMQRFRKMERLLQSRDCQWQDLARAEIAALWLESKSN